jgi:transcriptional regulator with XRE-family HTH domain
VKTNDSNNQQELAARLIAEIGAQGGLTQAELARRSGLDRSVLNAYAQGRRQPSVAAMGRIARGAGLELGLVPVTGDSDTERAGRVLSQVLDLAGSMPFRPKPTLEYPPLIRLRT